MTKSEKFAHCVLWSLTDVVTEYSRVPEVAEAFKVLIDIKHGKSVITDAQELQELRDFQRKVLNETARGETK